MIEIDLSALKVPAQAFHDECIVGRCSCAFLNDSSSYSPAPNNASSFHSISYFQLSSPLSSGNGVRIKIDAAPPTDNTQQWEKRAGRMAPLLPSLPNGRLKDCALSTADHPSSIKCSRHRRRRSPMGQTSHRRLRLQLYSWDSRNLPSK